MAPAISKRPAADVTTSTGSKKMKRPAAATGSLNKSVAELKAGLPDEEPDTSEGAWEMTAEISYCWGANT